MNTDTGEIRRMTEDERAELNRTGERWEPITDDQAAIASAISAMEFELKHVKSTKDADMAAAGASNRQMDRAAFRRAYGCSRFEARMRGLVK